MSKYPNEFKKIPNILLFCIKCSESVRPDRKVFVDNHRESMKHRNSSATPNQSFLYAPKLPDFNEGLVKAFLGANIPVKKVRNLGLRKLFTDIGQPLPCETSCRKKVEEIAKDDENRLRDILKDQPIFLIVDESEIEGKKYLNILGGRLNEPNKVYMLECKKLEKSPECSLVFQGVDDCVQKFGILRQNFNLLLSDAAA